MRRVPHFLLAVVLTRSDLRRFDLLLHKLMEEDLDGPLRASYYIRVAYTYGRGDSLDEIMSNELLPNVIHELTIRLEDSRRSIEVSFSRRGVVSRIMGGNFDEFWEAEAQKTVSAFMSEKRAKFLGLLFAPVIFLFCGAFYMTYAMAFGQNGLNIWTLLFYTAYIFASFFSSVLFLLHQRGILFPHAKITIRDPADAADSGNKVSITGVLSLIIQVIRLTADYFFPGARLTSKLLRHRPADVMTPRPRAVY